MKRVTGRVGWRGVAVAVGVVAAALFGSCAPAQPSPGVPPRVEPVQVADASPPDARDADSNAAPGDSGLGDVVILCEAIGCADVAFITVVLPIPAAEVARSKSRVCMGSLCVDTDPALPPGAAPGSFPYGRKAVIRLSANKTALQFRLLVPHDLAVDGTVYSVQVDSPTRGRVLSVSRALRTTSQGFHPAGPLCGTPCRQVVARWYPNSKSGITCNSDPCESGLVVHLDVRDVMAKLGGASVVQMCRNGLCADFPLPRFDEIVEGGWSASAVEGLMVESLVEFHPPSELRIKVLSDPIVLRANDRYVVRMYTAPHDLLWSYETVAKYETSFPNGAECDTVPCKTMVVHMKP